MNRNLIFLGVGVFALIFSYTAGAITEAKPSCPSMGYNKTAAECEGYAKVKCPWNSNAYFCDRSGGTYTNTSGTVDCENRNCNALGYNKTAEQCYGLTKLPCPFDNTKYFCGGLGCVEDGYNNQPCNSNQVELDVVDCPTDANYKKHVCQNITPKTCAPGDILASDLNCYEYISPSMTAIGVMFTDDLAVEVTRYHGTYMDGCNTTLLPYGVGNLDSFFGDKLDHCENTNNGRYCYSTFYNATIAEQLEYKTTPSDPKGKNDTLWIYNKIGQYLSGADQPFSFFPASYCYEKTTSGLPAHSWFLPAIGDMRRLDNNLSVVNAKINEVGGDAITKSGTCSFGLTSTLRYGYKAGAISGGYVKVMFYNTTSYEDGSVRCILSVSLASGN